MTGVHPPQAHPTAHSPLAVGLDELLARGRAGARDFARATPFPHAVFDDLFDLDALAHVVDEMPPIADPGWLTYDHAHEHKLVFDRIHEMGPYARSLAMELNSSEFVRFLETLTGISGLIPDPHLRQAGYFDVPTGGFLAPHLDFTTSRHLGLVRRVNALVYLNEGWQPEWGGQLELWNSLDGGPEREIVPVLGRLAVFCTPGAAHGHPRPVSAPGGRSRICFSAYYYSSPELAGAIEQAGVVWPDEALAPGRIRRWALRLAPPVLVDLARRRRRDRAADRHRLAPPRAARRGSGAQSST